MSNSGGVYSWSQTAAANATADSTVNWSPQMAPSAVGPSGRAMMASVAKYRDDIAGMIVTGGTSTAYTIASNQIFDSLTDMHNKVIAFTPHITNGATVLLNVDGLGQKPLRSAPNIEIASGMLVQGTPYAAIYNNTDGVFYLQGFFSNPYNIPIGASLEFWGSTAPNSSFVLPSGQPLNRTTYATLFGLIGTTYGAGDGTTTFNLPDPRGRVLAQKEAAQTNLTATWFGGDSTALGAVGGSQQGQLANVNQLPQFTPAGSITNGAISYGNVSIGSAAGGGNSLVTGGNSGTVALSTYVTGASQGASTFTGTPVGQASPNGFRTIQPTLICNRIMRVL